MTQHHGVVANYSLQGLLHGNKQLENFVKEEIANGKIIGLFAGQPEYEERTAAAARKVDGASFSVAERDSALPPSPPISAPVRFCGRRAKTRRPL